MKRASILKFKSDNKYIIHAINTLKGGGGIASKPYIIKKNLTNIKVAEELLLVLEQSEVDVPRPLDWKIFQMNHLKEMGYKTMKSLHDRSLNIGVFIKDNHYHISPTVNKGPKQGFQGAIEDRIIIPVDTTIDELAEALRTAFELSK